MYFAMFAMGYDIDILISLLPIGSDDEFTRKYHAGALFLVIDISVK